MVKAAVARAAAHKPAHLAKPKIAAKPPAQPAARPNAISLSHAVANGTIKILGKPVKKNGFTAGDYVVYPTHGVGKITGIEKRDLGGAELRLLVVNFEKDRMTLRVPVNKVETSGMRRLSSRDKMRSAMTVLKGRARVKRTMWSRRAQEYEAKINSGDPESIAEVVRDLHGRVGQPDQSYSERQLYEAALDRLVRELAAVERIDPVKAVEQVNRHLKVA
jgi:CarD family transcriptional regulator